MQTGSTLSQRVGESMKQIVQKTQMRNLQSVGRTVPAPDSAQSVDLDRADMYDRRQTQPTPSIQQKSFKKGITKTVVEGGYQEDPRIEKLKMYTELFDIEELKESMNFVIKSYKDSVYFGEIDPDTNERAGLGIIIYKNKRHYEGSWLLDRRHGRGYERFSNRNVYSGQYDMGKVQGKGVYDWSNGDKYDGEWSEGQKHGYGVWKNAQGDSYIGEWSYNMAHGYGVHEWANGDRYEGEWMNSLRHGSGSDRFANGDMYHGEYQYGNAEGQGQYKWANGNTYTGLFKDGKKQGQGVWKKQPGAATGHEGNQNWYDGGYKDDMKHGKGEFKWGTGGHYKGDYLNDVKSGYGEMTWGDGSIYKGTWDHGVQNGLGLMKFANGLKKAGTFKDNVLVEILNDENLIKAHESLRGNLPQDFKNDLHSFIDEVNPKEDQTFYLQTELKPNIYEERTQPNTLLLMQEANNAPWGQGSKKDYVMKIKIKDTGTQYDGPSQNMATQYSTPQGDPVYVIVDDSPKKRKEPQYIIVDEPSPKKKKEPVYIVIDKKKPDPEPVYVVVEPPRPPRTKMATPRLIFHDFDYVGFKNERAQNNRSTDEVKWNVSGSKMDNKSPRFTLPKFPKTRKESTGLPDIVKRGPTHYQTIGSKAPSVGLNTAYGGDGGQDRSNSNQRKPEQPTVKYSSRKKFSMPHLQFKSGNMGNSLDMYLKPKSNFRRLTESSKMSRDSSHKKALKTLISGKAWIPGGHPNSIGRNALASIQKSTYY